MSCVCVRTCSLFFIVLLGRRRSKKNNNTWRSIAQQPTEWRRASRRGKTTADCGTGLNWTVMQSLKHFASSSRRQTTGANTRRIERGRKGMYWLKCFSFSRRAEQSPGKMERRAQLIDKIVTQHTPNHPTTTSAWVCAAQWYRPKPSFFSTPFTPTQPSPPFLNAFLSPFDKSIHWDKLLFLFCFVFFFFYLLWFFQTPFFFFVSYFSLFNDSCSGRESELWTSNLMVVRDKLTSRKIKFDSW